MAETKPHKNAERSPVPGKASNETVATDQRDIEALINELFDRLNGSNLYWFERVRSETNLAAEFAAKLKESRSIPAAITSCQQWARIRLEMLAEDGARFLTDMHKVLETTASLRSSWPLSGPRSTAAKNDSAITNAA